MIACPVEASGTAAGRRFSIRTLAFMAGYVTVNVAAIFGAFDNARAPGSYALALVVAAPVLGQLWATYRLIEESDEFVRGLMSRRMVLASGLAIAAGSTWGFMETYAGAPHVPAWLIYPLFWGFYGVVTPFVRTTR